MRSVGVWRGPDPGSNIRCISPRKEPPTAPDSKRPIGPEPTPLQRIDYTEQTVASFEFSDPLEYLDALRKLPLSEARWIFRGQSGAGWDLAPLIERIPIREEFDIWEAERAALFSFKRRAHQYIRDVPEDNDALEWLALVRHYGGPTRLLDWTKSPYVATFFALADAGRDEPAAVWALDAQCLKMKAIKKMKATKTLSAQCDDMGFDMHLGSPENFGRFFLGDKTPEIAIAAPVEPVRMNERLTLQHGLFVCSNHLLSRFCRTLKNTLGESLLGQGYESPQPSLRKLVIDAGARANLLRDLERMNINYATLFPGIEGFARSLSTHMQMRGLGDSFIDLWADHLY